MLLILQNRGRQTAAQLADELEVAPRTILRDVSAMTEAGLPVLVHQGKNGGIELGFNYRSRLTGLNRDEARALGLMLAADSPLISALGIEDAARRARAKLLESLPDSSRVHASLVQSQFSNQTEYASMDPRVSAMATAVQRAVRVRIRFTTQAERTIHPTSLRVNADTWCVQDDREDEWIGLSEWGRINVSGQPFTLTTDSPSQPAQ